MEENESIGRLIRTLKEPCNDCGKRGLQLRIRDDLHYIDGLEVIEKNNYHYCKNCKEFTKLKNENFSRKRDWKPIEPIPEPEVKKWDKNKSKGDNSKFSKKG